MGTSSYEHAGVKGQADALSAVERLLGPTFAFTDAEVLTRFGHYAAVLKLTDTVAIAICTDGVGSKTMVASALDRYDTIGFDCVAMNVNDLICIGARPLALVDYLGVHTLDESRAAEVLSGLAEAAREAGIAIPGGEIAQLPEVIGSDGRVPGDERAFDLVGTAIGLVHPDRVMLGRAVRPGDAIVGLRSSGLHSNGFTLARRVLLRDAGYRLDDRPPGLQRSLGDELLEPTRIYVRAAVALWDEGIDVHGIVHITGDGFANLCRLESPVGYRIERLPDPPAIFGVIQEAGDIDTAEMYRVFNMGIGAVVIVAADEAARTTAAVERVGYAADIIGTVVDEDARVIIEPAGLIGTLDAGESVFSKI